MNQTLFERLWAKHVIVSNPGGEELLFVDRNLLHEGGTFLAFDPMRISGETVCKPKLTLAVTDHYLPSTHRATAPASTVYTCDIDATRTTRLLVGLDDVGVTLQQRAQIEAFETQYRTDMPWLAHLI